MAKYIIDLDSLKECLDFLSEGKINGHSYIYIQNVKAFIDRFPKEKYVENAKVNANTWLFDFASHVNSMTDDDVQISIQNAEHMTAECED